MRISFLLVVYFPLCLLSTSAYPETGSASPSHTVTGKYVINLLSTKDDLELRSLPNLEVFEQYRLYRTVIIYKKSQWNRLRLGFFTSRDEALSVLEKVRESYPRSWVTTVTTEERTTSTRKMVNLSSPMLRQNSLAIFSGSLPDTSKTSRPVKQKQTIKTPIINKKNIPVPREDVETKTKTKSQSTGKKTILQQARDAMTAKDYSRAVQLTTYLLNTPATKKDKQQALELLGLARERKKQHAHAKAEYEKYLSLYPKGEDATRVRQRLAGLVTANQPQTVALPTKSKKSRPEPEWRHIGSLSQFYYRNQFSDDTEQNQVAGSLLVSTLDTTSRLRTDEYNHRVQLTADNQYSFLDGESQSRFSNFYYEIVDRKVKNSFRIGRQTYDSSGVFGRFDGAIGGLEMSKLVSFSAAGGALLENDDIFDLERHRKFFSGNLNIGTIADKWDFNFYAINQLADNITDRKAYGTEIRYFEPNFNVFSLLDYDVHFNKLNTLIFNSNWVFSDSSTVFANIDIRKSPYLSTTNALQGQTATSVDELLKIYTEDELKQLALDRTAQINTYTFGGTLALQNLIIGYGDYRLSLDLTITNTSSTPASGGVTATEATGNQYFLNTQLIGSSIFSRGDTSILSFQTGYSQDAEDFTIGVNSRFAFFKTWRFNPIIRYNNRSNKRTNSTRKLTRISGRIENRFQRNILFETELGIDYETDNAGGIDQKSDNLFFHLGYRIDF